MATEAVYRGESGPSTRRGGAWWALTLVLAMATLSALPATAARAVVTTEPRTDLRTGPTRDHDRITVLPPGIKLWADDYVDGFYRIPLTPMLTASVEEAHVRLLDRSVPRPATQAVEDISLRGGDAGTVVALDIGQPVAFRVRQQLAPPALILDLFGVRLAHYGVRQLPSDRTV